MTESELTGFIERRRRILARRRRVLKVAAGSVAASLVACVGVFAYFLSHGTGAGSASVGVLDAPTNVVATANNGSTSIGPSPVTITWSAPGSGATPTGYQVKRDDGATQTLVSCSSSPCTDTGVTDGSYTYHVKSLIGTSWTSTAADSNSLTVQNQAPTSTTVASSHNPSVVGEQVTYTATVTWSGSGTPTGSVTFKDGASTIICESGSSPPLNGSAQATCKVTYAAVAGSPHAITGVYGGDAHFLGSTSSPALSQVVNKADQAITFTSTAPANAKVAGATYAPTTTGGGSGNPVLKTIDATASSVCSISAGVVSFQSVGTCVIDANQAGNANYNAAPQVQQSFAVAKGDQTITFAALADRRLDQSPFSVSATATSGLAVSFTSATTSVCTVSATSVTLLHAGTCTVNADQAGNANWNAAPQVQRSFTVQKGNQAITFPALTGVRLDQAAPSPAATSSSGLAVTYSTSSTACSVTSVGVITLLHAGTCAINADQPGNSDWNAASQVQRSFTVTQGNQTIAFTQPADLRFDEAPAALVATASSGLAVSFTSATTSVCTVSGSAVTLVHAGTCTINANQAGNGDWNAASPVQKSFTVNKGLQTITFTQPADLRFDQTPAALNATTNAALTVTFTSATTSVCTVSGTTVTLVHVGLCTINASQAGNGDWAAATQVQKSFTISKGNQAINFAAIANRRLDQSPFTVAATATSGLAVTFTSATTSTCTVSGTNVTLLHPGPCTINADQAGNSDWNAAAQAPQSFTINKGNQTVTFGTAPAFARTGVSGSSVSATASSALAVLFGSSTSSICTVNGSTGALSLLAIGLCTITGDQAGTTDWNAAPQASQGFQVYNGATAGLIFTGVTLNGVSKTPTCTGVVGTTYSCTTPGVSNNSTLAATITFANSSAAATIFSIQDQTVSVAYGGKNPGPNPVTILGNQTGSSAQAHVDRNGNNNASITVTFTRPDGGTWTAVLSTT